MIKMPLNIQPRLLSSITLGKDMSLKHEIKIKKLCAQRQIKLKVYKAEYDTLAQELIRREIEIAQH
jgi:hypothetical protein